MNPTTLSQLLELNRQFYQTFALPFSATRMRLQPGVKRILGGIGAAETILDLGCGNGELARELARRGYRGNYIGLDFSSNLLAQAAAGLPPAFRFLQADLSASDWDAPLLDFHPTLVVAFAVLHHIPGENLRLQLLSQVHHLLAPGGRFIHSNWQFLNSSRLRNRIQPWETLGLTPSAVDPGDYLLDWRQGGTGLRYVHHFSEQELLSLASLTGFDLVESFLSDGATHNLGLYNVWKIL